MLARPGTAPSLALGGGGGDLRRSSSAHALARKKQDLFSGSSPAPSESGSTSQANLMTRSKRVSSAASERSGEGNRQVIGWKPASVFRIHTPPPQVTGQAPARPGRLESEKYGHGYHETGSFGPDVRKRQIPWIKPLSYPSEHEMRSKPRPSSAIATPMETLTQTFVIRGTHRSSDVIGSYYALRPERAAGMATRHYTAPAPASAAATALEGQHEAGTAAAPAAASEAPPPPAALSSTASSNEGHLGPKKAEMLALFAQVAASNQTADPVGSDDPKVLNYEAQFLYNDWRVPPEGGTKRRTNSASILRAHKWQKEFADEAFQLSSWDSKLNLSGSDVKLHKSASFVGDAYAAARIKQKQAMADIRTKKTQHSLTGGEMMAEAFDNVYSEEHANKDTASAMSSGGKGANGAFMVPTIDQRHSIIRPKDIAYGATPMVKTRHGPKPLLPSRSFMAIGEMGADRAGPGRAIDF